MFRRRLIAFCSAVSLLLCAAVCVLWVRSYAVGEIVSHSAPTRVAAIHAGAGRFGVTFATGTFRLDESGRDRGFGYERRAYPMSPVEGRHGFAYKAFTVPAAPDAGWTGVLRVAAVPAWLLAVMTLLLPSWWLLSKARARRHVRSGRCPKCGYDLRATPARCPECGATPTGNIPA